MDKTKVEQARQEFPTTRWSLVLQARESHAFSSLCSLYREPLLTYVRRARRFSHEDAEDLVQDFFTCLSDRRALAPQRDPGKPFRCYLLGALKHHLSRARRRARAQKRGSGLAEDQYDEARAGQAQDAGEAELAYDRAWASATLERALQHVEACYLREGRGALFFALRGLLIGEQAQSPCETQMRVALHRFRRRLAREVRALLAVTASDERELDHELQHLTYVLRSTGWTFDDS